MATNFENLEYVWNVCLNNSFQFFWKYLWVKKCVEIHVMLFKNWKYVFIHMYQTGFKHVGVCVWERALWWLWLKGFFFFFGPFLFFLAIRWSINSSQYGLLVLFKGYLCMIFWYWLIDLLSTGARRQFRELSIYHRVQLVSRCDTYLKLNSCSYVNGFSDYWPLDVSQTLSCQL